MQKLILNPLYNLSLKTLKRICFNIIETKKDKEIAPICVLSQYLHHF
ncbi:hypothetical protein Holit_00172 [Hollandina sp. SP2]